MQLSLNQGLWRASVVLFFDFAMGLGPQSFGQSFTRITEGAIATNQSRFTGCAWGDYDQDGYPDLYVAGLHSVLYHNDRNGTFSIPIELSFPGAPLMSAMFQNGCAWGDFNNDGALDLLSTGVGIEGAGAYVFQNTGPRTRFTALKLLPEWPNAYNPAWADYDNDGRLDFIEQNRFSGNANGLFLYHNLGSGAFTPIMLTNIGGFFTDYQSVWADYDNDGDMDLSVVVRNGQKNWLYRNHGRGNLAQILEDDFVESADSTTAAWADYDNDGDLDLFVANGKGQNNFLYQNNGDGTFTRITNGIVVNDGGNSFNGTWADFDNDGWLDLFVANFGENNFLYRNNGDGSFARITQGAIVNDGGNSTASAAADYDNDGFVDLFVTNTNTNYPGFFAGTNNFLYHNNGNANRWIKIKCVGSPSNRSAIGTKVRVKAMIGGVPVWQMREISGGNGTSQNELSANFGLGTATHADVVRIEWPSGGWQTLTNLSSNRILEIVEGRWAFAPQIMEHPQSRNVIAGSNIVLKVMVVGRPPLEYQWRFNGSNIMGETNTTLILRNVQASDTGRYSVLVIDRASDAAIASRVARIQLGPQISNPRMSQGGFQMTINGPVGARSFIQATSDLREWLPVGFVTNSAGAVEFSDPSATHFLMRFYRAQEIETASE